MKVNKVIIKNNKLKNELLGRFTEHLNNTLLKVYSVNDYETIIDELTNKLNYLEDDLGYD